MATVFVVVAVVVLISTTVVPKILLLDRVQ